MRLRGKVALLTGAAAAIKGELRAFGGASVGTRGREGSAGRSLRPRNRQSPSHELIAVD